MTTATATFSTLGLAPSFGFGDRLGLATPGHIEAMRRAGEGISPIYAQQSIREMQRTVRTPEQVVADAIAGIKAGNWSGTHGADADHLKTPQDVDVTAAVGFTFYTIDPSDFVDTSADDYAEFAVRDKFASVADECEWYDEYVGREETLSTGTKIEFTEEACMRAAIKYGAAIKLALKMARHIAQVNGEGDRDFEIELSVDETPQPTTLVEHFIIADQCLRHDMKLVSLAPRFIGDLEKGVDYNGDLEQLEASLADHAAIAELLGPYKLSLHSGSDKLSMYPALARATGGRFHVKTAGTSYLEALRVASRRDNSLFRRIIDFARERYELDRATYHVSATLDSAPPQKEITDNDKLEQTYLERWSDVPEGRGFTQPGRQILHCTFGSVLLHEELGPALRNMLTEHQQDYDEILAEHFERHLAALRQGM